MRRSIAGSLFVAVAALGFGVTGCGADDPQYAPAFGENGGQGVLVEDGYAPGPYGVALGETLPNLSWLGYVDSTSELGKGYRVISLADFYNPSGTATYGEGELYSAGTPRPTALWITGPAMWCGPCQAEARYILPPAHEEFFPAGQQLGTLLDNGAGSGPATLSGLDYWAKTYKANYPMVNDPEYSMGPAFQEQAFPANFLIDTRDMKIKEAFAGSPIPHECCPKYGCSNGALPGVCSTFGMNACGSPVDCSFWSDYEAIMAGTFQP